MKDLALHILDIVHNAISAKATLIEVDIRESEKEDILTLVIKDNGRGIAPKMLETVTDAYTTTRTTRKVGMGLPLLRQNAEQSGGGISVESEVDKGTTVTAKFGLQHIDRPPLGEISGVMVDLAASRTEVEFVYRHTTSVESYCFDTREVKEALDGMPMADAQMRRYLISMIDENLDEIKATR
ncbi:MAG: ATP-binding protein [Clostridia bacterium]|nr:ATP-binding protein [Clostridia bacterium]